MGDAVGLDGFNGLGSLSRDLRADVALETAEAPMTALKEAVLRGTKGGA
jgi:hypothetical protein